jgi:predicted ATPase
MLTHLKLDNFKIWKSTGPMRLAPLTFFLGTNSSGKSSLIQSLLLIRQTVKGDDSNLDLNFGNPDARDSVTLGQFRDVLCHHGDRNRIGIEFRWVIGNDASDSTIFTANYRPGPAGSAELDSLRLGRDDQGFTVLRRKSGVYRLQLGNERKSLGQSAEFRPQRSFALSPAVLARLGAAGERIKDVGPALLSELGRIIYLGPVRRLAQRDYVWAGRMPASLGDDGGKAVDALIASGVAAQAATRHGGPAPVEAGLITEAAKWLREMGLADGLSVKTARGSSRYELIVEREGDQTNLKDVGVGVSQVLPVIVAAVYAAPGQIVIVEEPESHLHPLAETVLADLFINTSKQRGVQFIVETHSEHLLTRLQRRTAEAQAASSDIEIYFCKRSGITAEVERIRLNEQGDIENWPPNFFGNEMEDIAARTLEALKRSGQAAGES